MKIHSPLFSVITVCRNAGGVLGATMESVRRQSCRDYEYIIVDGASTDATADIVRSFGDLVTTYVSEPDKGIYDAMNKGIRLARGQWIYFLNANDFLADPQVLEHAAAKLGSRPDAMLAYGDVYYRTGGSSALYRFDWLSRWNLCFEHLCHQAVFARRSLFERIGAFDERYKINADYDWLLRAFHAGIDTHYLKFPVASYDTAGLSSRNLEFVVAERRLVRQRHRSPLTGLPFEWIYRAYRKAKRLAGLDSRTYTQAGQAPRAGGRSS